MENNNLIKYKENIFTKIFKFFKEKFNKNKHVEESYNKEYISHPATNFSNNDCFQNYRIIPNSEEIRLKKLQTLYENGEIDEDEISDEDIDKLVHMYEVETNELNMDTERRKNHIAKMLQELK